MERVIVAGSREFWNYVKMRDFLDEWLEPYNVTEIVSGGARGADTLGERYAKRRKYDVRRFRAHWDKYGKAAGIIRNGEMAEYGDRLCAFWDGKSRGTMDMIGKALDRGMPVRYYREDTGDVVSLNWEDE